MHEVTLLHSLIFVILGISVMCLAIKYKIYLLQPQPYKLGRLLCLQKATAGSAPIQQSDMRNRDQGLVVQANTTKCWEPACFVVLRLTGTCPIKHQNLFFFHLKFTPV